MPTNRPWPPFAKPPQLGADEVHAWLVPLNLSRQHYEALLATLASDERERASDFRFDDPRRRYVIARGTLRRLLGDYLDLPFAQVELTNDGNQKPRLGNEHADADLHFNVSHSGDLAMIAVARGCEVGIDVEQLRDVGRLEQIARRFFHPSEVNDVLSTPVAARNLAFLRCWTGKEAILKALGTGIVGGLAAFQVPVSADRPGWIECSAGLSHQRPSRCWLEQLTPHDSYVAAIACVESNRLVRPYAIAM